MVEKVRATPMPDKRTFDAAFLRLGRSKVQRRFRLSAADRMYISDKGLGMDHTLS